MAIQNRRGIYSDFDPTKMVEGEFAVVQSGDPNTSDGKAVYIAPTTGTAERVALYKDLQQEVQAAITDATDEVIQEVTAGIIEGVAEDVTKAETAATNAEQSAQDAEASAEEAQEVLENKADNNGYYPDLYAGNLSSTRKQTDSVPYLMRKTGGDLSRIGEREDDTLVGATVNVNQRIISRVSSDTTYTKNGVTIVCKPDGSIVMNGTANAFFWLSTTSSKLPLVKKANTAGHKIIYWFSSDHSFLNRQIGDGSQGYRVITDTNAVIASRPENARNTDDMIQLQVESGDTFDNAVIYPCLIDLTQWLGSTIADYLYNLETATAGAGVAKLREWGFLTDEYIPYNSGSLESVEATAHKMVGFNQWDEEWEVGQYTISSGAKGTRADAIRCKNMIPVMPNTAYYFHCGSHPTAGDGVWLWYGIDGSYIGNVTGKMNREQTSPSDAYFMTFYVAPETTYHNDICINLSSDRNGEYEPYHSQSYPLGDDTLRGIFKLDANNRLYADGDVKSADGTVTRKYGVVDLGTLTWGKENTQSGHWRFNANFPGAKLSVSAASIPNLVCTKYNGVSPNDTWIGTTGVTINNTSQLVMVCDEAYADTTAFKTAMSGVMLVYELATPTTEQSTPFQNPQICDPDGTEEYVTNNSVPVGHETEYDYDIKGLAEELIDVPDVPSTNGTYVLKATRSASGISYEWVSST